LKLVARVRAQFVDDMPATLEEFCRELPKQDRCRTDRQGTNDEAPSNIAGRFVVTFLTVIHDQSGQGGN
jgi:hypothetical protein